MSTTTPPSGPNDLITSALVWVNIPHPLPTQVVMETPPTRRRLFECVRATSPQLRALGGILVRHPKCAQCTSEWYLELNHICFDVWDGTIPIGPTPGSAGTENYLRCNTSDLGLRAHWVGVVGGLGK